MKSSKYGVFSGPFSPNAGKYGPEKGSYLDTFHAVRVILQRAYLRMYRHFFSCTNNNLMSSAFFLKFFFIPKIHIFDKNSVVLGKVIKIKNCKKPNLS